jgi:fructokinase
MKAGIQVTCVGEAIVDFVSTKAGVSLSGSPGFTKHAGGSPANIAAGLSKLGVRSAFAGKVGMDPFGMFLREALERAGVDSEGIRFDRDYRTRIAFVSRSARGEREFEFWETLPADERLTSSDLDAARIARSRIVHLSSFLLLREPARSALLALARTLSRRGCVISFDPNIRKSLWTSEQHARRLLLAVVKMSSVLRLNGSEAFFLTGIGSIAGAARNLLSRGPALVVITLGKDGCFLATKRISLVSPGFRVRAVDTTGCGDAFHAALLSGILGTGSAPGEQTLRELASICEFSNAAGALTAMKPGVIEALPTRRQVNTFLRSAGRKL